MFCQTFEVICSFTAPNMLKKQQVLFSVMFCAGFLYLIMILDFSVTSSAWAKRRLVLRKSEEKQKRRLDLLFTVF